MTVLLGLIFGALQTGFFTVRTLQVQAGQVGNVLFTSIILSAAGWFSTSFVANHDVPGYIGFTIGSAVACMGLALKQRHDHQTGATHADKPATDGQASRS